MLQPASPPHRVRQPMPGVVYPSDEHNQRYAGLGVLGTKTLPGALRATAQIHGDQPAIVGADQVITHRELDELTDRVAAALLRLGLRPLDRAVMHVGESPELLVAFIATLKAGLIPISTLAAHREAEIGQLTAQSQARLIWSHGDAAKFDHVAFAERMQGLHPSLQFIATSTPTATAHPSLQALADSVDLATAQALLATVEHDPWQVAVFQLSGGTTGTPKIIPRLHSEYVYNIEASAAFLGLQPGERLFMPTPMMHNVHVVCGWGPVLLSGGSVIVRPQPAPDVTAAAVAAHRPTRLFLPPPLIAKATQSPLWDPAALTEVRGMMAPFGARALAAGLGVPSHHVFGMTEGVIMYSCGVPSEAARFDTVGRPISAHDEIRILKPGTEEDAAPGEAGELAIRGPYTLFGYYAAPERNREAFTSDGFYRSGDLMSEVDIDGQRHYCFKGRLKDVVDRGGEKISAEEVEQAAMRSGAFLAVAVVGAPDPVFSERVCACVIPRPGVPLPDVQALGRHMESLGLAKFKWPERIEALEVLPLTHVGKVDKAALKRQLFKPEGSA